MRTFGKDNVVLGCTSLVLLMGGLLAWHWIGASAVVVMLAVSTALVLGGLSVTFRRLRRQVAEVNQNLMRQMNDDYRQLEALASLYAAVKPDLPLPEPRGWAASPDFLSRLAEVILQKRPTLVVEAGSGVSTLITAYCLKRLGGGRVISLDHDAQYAASTQRAIAFHGLEDVATVVHAPLREVEIDGNAWLWYDLDGVELDHPIDVLTIDGPPDTTQRLARYPAMPLLHDRLGGEAVILLDDGGRADEQEVVARWEKEFGDIGSEYLQLEKGAFIIRRQAKQPTAAEAPNRSLEPHAL
jgi:predicted O-methyltransferase YrrM